MSRSWSPDDLSRWRAGLRFISLPWVAEIYPKLGLPGEPPIREAIRDWAAAAVSDEERDRPASKDAGRHDTARVRRHLADLAEVTSMAAADATEAWLERHFVSTQLGTALYVWHAVLQRAAAAPGGPYPLVEPPQPLRPAVALLADSPSSRSVSTVVAAKAPAVSPAERELGLDIAVDALTAIEISDREATWKSLEELAGSLGPDGRRAAHEWARQQAAALDFPAERLGAEYPSANLPDGPVPIRLL